MFEQNEYLRTYFELLDASSQLIPVLELSVDQEIARPGSQPSTLLRGTGIPAKLAGALLAYECADYLGDCMRTLIAEVMKQGAAMDVDAGGAAAAAGAGTTAVTPAQKAVVAMCQRIFDSLVSAQQSLPPFVPSLPLSLSLSLSLSLNHIHLSILLCSRLIEYATLLFQGTKAKFKGTPAAQTAVAGLLFFRWICPAIQSPETSNLTSQTPSKEARKTLILIGKALQSLAVGQSRTDFLEEFVQKNLGAMTTYLEGISVRPFVVVVVVVVVELTPFFLYFASSCSLSLTHNAPLSV